MIQNPTLEAHQIIVVDDDPGLLDAYRRVFAPMVIVTRDPDDEQGGGAFEALATSLFGGDGSAEAPRILAGVSYCQQGEEAVARVREAVSRNQPIAVAFIDMRMPPGIDGMETARRIRAIDPRVNIVVVTGYSDRSSGEIAAKIGHADKLFYLSKPYDRDEIQQLAAALTRRWALDQATARELADRVRELERLNAELKASEARARAAARLDALTGLPNRAAFVEHAGAVLAGPGELSLLYLDLDRFKEVNDSLGHAAGDELLRAVTARLRDVVGADGFCARLGGDEFAVLTPRNLSRLIAEKLIAACELPFSTLGRMVGVRLSIGLAHRDGDIASEVELMRRADVALYDAKASGRGRLREFDPQVDQTSLANSLLAADLEAALGTSALDVQYQPIVAADGAICGLEAQLAWTHVRLGPISPTIFMPVAEKSHLVHDLGRWALARALDDARNWPHFVTGVGLTAAQFARRGLAEELRDLAQKAGTDPARIELQVNEALLIDDIEAAADQISRLKEAGFKVALDDFGVSYSSFNYLRWIPFDNLKIDRSFVDNLTRSAGAAAVVQSIVSLGHALGLSVTAEGVEQPDQKSLLSALGCSQVQGRLLYGPMSKAEILALDIEASRLKAAS